MSILSISPEQYDQTLNFGDAIGFGGQMVLIGMVAIFAVLGLIWALLTVFKLVFATTNDKGSAPKAQPQPSSTQHVAAINESEIVAVIAAAIAMAESESDTGMKFRVVSFRRK